jgi:exosortase/archaeosortase family protein
VLAGEIIFFTLLFEFKSGPMRLVANSIVLTGLVVGVIGFMMLAGQRANPLALPRSRNSRSSTLTWACIHVGCLVGFYFLTQQIQAAASGATTGWLVSVFWLTVAAFVATSCLLTVFRLGAIVAYLRQSAFPLAGGAVVAALMILLTPATRELWLSTNGPALQLIVQLLEWFPGYANVAFLGSDRPVPIVGTSNLPLVITQHCSEMETLLAYTLLGVLLMIAGGRRMMSFLFLAPFFVGFELLYVLNAVRLYLLLLMGHILVDTSWAAYAGRACVSLAHSRVGSFLLLSIAVLILLVGERLSRREWVVATDGKPPA